jgi:hypothetical protein
MSLTYRYIKKLQGLGDVDVALGVTVAKILDAFKEQPYCLAEVGAAARAVVSIVAAEAVVVSLVAAEAVVVSLVAAEAVPEITALLLGIHTCT